MANGKVDWSSWFKSQGTKAPEKKLTKEIVVDGDTTSVELTPYQYISNLNRKEKEAKKEKELNYSRKMPDGTIIKAESISDLKKEIDAYNELTTPEKPEKVDESAKRDKWLKEMVKNQEAMDSQIETTDDEGKETYVDLLNDAQVGMFKNQQSALTDSVNYSYGREAMKSNQNFKNFMKQRGIQAQADAQLNKFFDEVKMGKHGAIAPGKEEEVAKELTDRWFSKMMKETYGIEL